MRKLFFWSLVMLLLSGLLGICLGGRPYGIEPSIEEHRTNLISRIAEVAELITLKVPVSQVMTSELTGYVGGIRCVVVVNGEVALGVDLEQAQMEDVDPDTRTATLFLPQPEVQYARLDHQRTKIYDISRQGLWWLAWGDEGAQKLINKMIREAQASVEGVAGDRGLVDQARRQAEDVIHGVAEAGGWDIRLSWGH